MKEANMDALHFNTKVIHAGYRRDAEFGALATPIYQTATFSFTDADQAMGVFSGELPGYDYTRSGNPTVQVFEDKMKELEGGEAAVSTASGLGAIGAALIGLLRSGDHIVCSNLLYGGTNDIMRNILPTLGVTVTFTDTADISAVETAIQPNTRMIYFETPSNPTMHMTDIAAVCALKSKYPRIYIVVDNTFAPPPVQRPLRWGADVVVHSATKYINGHGDVIAGVAVGSEEAISQIRGRAMNRITGSCLPPVCAYMITRGMQTLGLRMERHCSNAMALATYLEEAPYVEKVYYPGLPSMGHDHEIAKRQMEGIYGGMISFVMRDGINGMSGFDAGKKFVNSLRVATLATSLGETETLIQHPASMSQGKVPKELREKAGVVDGMLRLSVGIEDIRDLLADFDRAFAEL